MLKPLRQIAENRMVSLKREKLKTLKTLLIDTQDTHQVFS